MLKKPTIGRNLLFVAAIALVANIYAGRTSTHSKRSWLTSEAR